MRLMSISYRAFRATRPRGPPPHHTTLSSLAVRRFQQLLKLCISERMYAVSPQVRKLSISELMVYINPSFLFGTLGFGSFLEPFHGACPDVFAVHSLLTLLRKLLFPSNRSTCRYKDRDRLGPFQKCDW
jgi:hypothetical protein